MRDNYSCVKQQKDIFAPRKKNIHLRGFELVTFTFTPSPPMKKSLTGRIRNRVHCMEAACLRVMPRRIVTITTIIFILIIQKQELQILSHIARNTIKLIFPLLYLRSSNMNNTSFLLSQQTRSHFFQHVPVIFSPRFTHLLPNI